MNSNVLPKNLRAGYFNVSAKVRQRVHPFGQDPFSCDGPSSRQIHLSRDGLDFLPRLRILLLRQLEFGVRLFSHLHRFI
jgi:hypothetical protein